MRKEMIFWSCLFYVISLLDVLVTKIVIGEVFCYELNPLSRLLLHEWGYFSFVFLRTLMFLVLVSVSIFLTKNDSTRCAHLVKKGCVGYVSLWCLGVIFGVLEVL